MQQRIIFLPRRCKFTHHTHVPIRAFLQACAKYNGGFKPVAARIVHDASNQRRSFLMVCGWLCFFKVCEV